MDLYRTHKPGTFPLGQQCRSGFERSGTQKAAVRDFAECICKMRGIMNRGKYIGHEQREILQIVIHAKDVGKLVDHPRYPRIFEATK